MKYLKKFNENINFENPVSIMGKDIINNCEYYGEENLFFVYNKKEDWFIKFSRGLSSEQRTWVKTCDVSLHENIIKYGYKWKYAMDYDGFDEDKILTQDEFFIFLNESFN